MTIAKLIAVSKPVGLSINSAEDLIAYCARVSNPANQMNTETAPKLLSYLVRNKHWSPFEMASMTVEIVTTRDIARQILRHRSFSFQEFSQRYAAVSSPPIFRNARLQDLKNRQNSLPVVESELQDWWRREQQVVARAAEATYQLALAAGIAKEVARSVLPEGMTESRLYMAGTVRSFIHYCDLRCGNGTQAEHREVADEVREILYREFPALVGIG